MPLRVLFSDDSLIYTLHQWLGSYNLNFLGWHMSTYVHHSSHTDYILSSLPVYLDNLEVNALQDRTSNIVFLLLFMLFSKCSHLPLLILSNIMISFIKTSVSSCLALKRERARSRDHRPRSTCSLISVNSRSTAVHKRTLL